MQKHVREHLAERVFVRKALARAVPGGEAEAFVVEFGEQPLVRLGELFVQLAAPFERQVGPVGRGVRERTRPCPLRPVIEKWMTAFPSTHAGGVPSSGWHIDAN